MEDSLCSRMEQAIAEADQPFLEATLAGGFTVEDDLAEHGCSLLHFACWSGEVASAMLLLAHGWSRFLDVTDDIVHYPLSIAARTGNEQMALLLLAAGAKVNLRDAERLGDTAITEAVRTERIQIAKLLLLCGADPTIGGWHDQSALNIAIGLARETGSSDESRAMVRLLLEHLSKEFTDDAPAAD